MLDFRVPRGALSLLLLSACGGVPAPPPAGPSPEAVQTYTHAAVLLNSGRVEEAAKGFDEAAALDPASAEVWVAAARARLRLSEWPAAIERARSALKAEADVEGAYEVLGEALLSSGRFDEAKALFRDLIARDKALPIAWRGQARVAGLAGDLEGAEVAFTKLVEVSEGSAEDWERLGDLRHRLNRPAPAARAYAQAVGLDPRRRDLDHKILGLALSAGDIDIAREAAQRLAGEGADPAGAAIALAAMLLKRNDPVAAAGELERLLELQPENWRATLMLAHVHARVERYAAGAELAARIPKDAPQWLDAQRLQAVAMLEQKKIAEAIALLEAARHHAPNKVELLTDLSHALRSQGEHERARRELAEGIERWPTKPRVRYMHAIVLHDLGKTKAAIKAMEGLVELAPDHAGALNFLGFTWAERNEQLERAEQYIRKALAQRPDDGAIIDSLGWVLYRQDRLEEAEQALRKALALSPKEGEIHFHLAEVLWKAGKKVEARGHFDKAVSFTEEPARKRRYQKRRKATGK